MKFKLFVFLIFTLSLFSQKKENNYQDSIAYDIKQANFNTNRYNYKRALIFAQDAIDLSQKNVDSIYISKSNASIGYIYFKLHKFNDAINSLQKSVAHFLPNKPLGEKASIYYLLGLCYIEVKNAQSAEIFFNKADTIYKAENNLKAREMLNLQKGIVYKSKGKLELARVLFENILFESDDNNDEFRTKAEALYHIGTIEAQFERNSLALNYLNRALVINQKNIDTEQKSKILLSLSLVYEKLGEHILCFRVYYLTRVLRLKRAYCF